MHEAFDQQSTFSAKLSSFRLPLGYMVTDRPKSRRKYLLDRCTDTIQGFTIVPDLLLNFAIGNATNKALCSVQKWAGPRDGSERVQCSLDN